MHADAAPRQFLRLRDVIALTGHKRSSIYAAMKENRFPKAIQIGLKAVAWDAAEITAWQVARMNERKATKLH
jgi:prophage regulatory protein